MVGVYCALLSPDPLASGFNDIRAATAWIDGPVTLLESDDSLSIRRGDGSDLILRKIDLRQDDSAARYAAALLFRFDLEIIQSAALAWELMIAILSEQDSYDVWNGAYPAQTIAKYAELRPLTLVGTHGYVMRPSEFDRLAERVPE